MGKLWLVLTLKVLYAVVMIKTSPVAEISNNVEKRCEIMTIPFCQQLAYNETIFPNLMGNEKQAEAATEVHQFTPLVSVNCSPDLKRFLCSVYAPICANANNAPVPPCRHLCLSARHNCDKLMMNFGFSWPENMECSKFPVATDVGTKCFDGTKIIPESPDENNQSAACEDKKKQLLAEIETLRAELLQYRKKLIMIHELTTYD